MNRERSTIPDALPDVPACAAPLTTKAGCQRMASAHYAPCLVLASRARQDFNSLLSMSI